MLWQPSTRLAFGPQAVVERRQGLADLDQVGHPVGRIVEFLELRVDFGQRDHDGLAIQTSSKRQQLLLLYAPQPVASAMHVRSGRGS